MAIGVLALQGGFQAHTDALASLGEEVRFIRTPKELTGCEGLVLPGGESSAMLILMADDPSWFEVIQAFARDHWILGTCAGMILLADQVIPEQASLKLLPISVERNAYGRQRDSRMATIPYQTLGGQTIDVEVVFIRAPKISMLISDTQVLLEEAGQPLLVQQGPIMAASFHPESAINCVLYQDCLKRLRQVTA